MDLRGKRRNGLAGVVLGASLAGLLSACAGGSGPEDVYKRITTVDYGKPYLGMSKAEVLRCAGEPRSRIPAGKTTETLVYHYSGAGPVPSAAPAEEKKTGPFKTKKKPKGNFNCTASLTFEKDTLVRVNYAHMNVRSPYDWQSEDNPEKAKKMRDEGVPTCTFSLPRCPR